MKVFGKINGIPMMKHGKVLISIILILVFTAAMCMAEAIRARLTGGESSDEQVELAVTYKSASLEIWEVQWEIYIFLPSYFDRDETWLTLENGEISLDGGGFSEKVCIGTLDDTHYSYVITADDGEERSGDLYIYQSAGTASVFIDTESGSMDAVDADKEYKEEGTIVIKDEDGGTIAADSLEYIKGRGNITWQTEKKSYGIRLSTKSDLFGMGAASDWVLVSNIYDGTNILNKLCYDMAGAIGVDYAVEGEWVDLWLNGEYHGNYLLCEKVQVAENRVEAYDGYLIEVDNTFDPDSSEESGFITDDGNPFTIHYPDDATDEETAEVAALVQQIEDAIRAGDLEAASEYLDWDSFILRYLLDETVYKHDMGTSSMYFYVSDGKLYSGPAWDYDNCMGTGAYFSYWMDYTFVAARDNANYRTDTFLSWYPLLYENEWFIGEVTEKYEEVVRPYLIWVLEDGIDEYAAEAQAAVEMDMIRWDYAIYDAGHYDEYENNVRYLKYFLANRLSFLDLEWLGEENDYYWEGDGSTHTVQFTGENGTVTIEVLDGEVITDTPDYLLGEGGWWCRDGGRASSINEFLPILEDMEFIQVGGG